MDAKTLLAGPRGRRLMLEFARWSEEAVGGNDLYAAMRRAEELFDPDPSEATTVRMAEFGDSSLANDAVTDPAPTCGVAFAAGPGTAPGDPALTYGPVPGGTRIRQRIQPRAGSRAAAREVAARIDAVALADVAWETLSEPLLMMVGWARYWQPPDGTDVMAASDPVLGALVRVAEHVVSSSETAWWTSGVDTRSQWAMLWEGADPVPPMDSGHRSLAAARAYVVEAEEDARRNRSADPRASYTGDWWSSPRFPRTGPETTRLSPTGVPLQAWLVEDGFGWDEGEALRLDVPAGMRIFEIDSRGAWVELCRRFPIEVTAQKRHDWYDTTGRAGRWTMPDWAAVAGEYDAVHLQAGAYLAAAGTAIPVDDERSTVIAGWDPDATFWFTDRVHYTGERIRCVHGENGRRQTWETAAS